MNLFRGRKVLTAMKTAGACTTIAPYEAGVADHPEECRPVIDALSARLAVADLVAVTKWDTETPVEDPRRERAVKSTAIRDAPAHGLATEHAAAFFADQIEANKLIQHRPLASWHRAGSAPCIPRADLDTTIRPQLDALHERLLLALSAIRPCVRAQIAWRRSLRPIMSGRLITSTTPCMSSHWTAHSRVSAMRHAR